MNILDKIKHDKLYKNVCPSCNRKGTIGVGIEDNKFYCSCGKRFYATKDEYRELN